MWETSTCKLGWEVNGVFPQGADGTDINNVDCNKNRSLIAVGDDFGTMCVYRFPACKSKNEEHDCIRMGGHSSFVTNVQFYEPSSNPLESRIISAGGNDRTYIQWKPVENIS